MRTFVGIIPLALVACGAGHEKVSDFREAGREEVVEAAKECRIRDPEHYYVGEEANGIRSKSGPLTTAQRKCLEDWQARHKVRFEF